MIRTLAYLKSKNQAYKFEVMKMYSLVIIFGTIGYLVINSVALGYNMLGDSDDVWRIQHDL